MGNVRAHHRRSVRWLRAVQYYIIFHTPKNRLVNKLQLVSKRHGYSWVMGVGTTTRTLTRWYPYPLPMWVWPTRAIPYSDVDMADAEENIRANGMIF